MVSGTGALPLSALPPAGVPGTGRGALGGGSARARGVTAQALEGLRVSGAEGRLDL